MYNSQKSRVHKASRPKKGSPTTPRPSSLKSMLPLNPSSYQGKIVINIRNIDTKTASESSEIEREEETVTYLVMSETEEIKAEKRVASQQKKKIKKSDSIFLTQDEGVLKCILYSVSSCPYISLWLWQIPY